MAKRIRIDLLGGARALALTVLALTVLAVSVAVPAAALQATSPPERPTGLRAASDAYDSVSLSWDDPGDDSITHYWVLRRDRDTDAPGVFATIDSDTGTADPSYVDTTAKPAKRYVYRVIAVNAAGGSPRSSYVNVDTLAAPPVTDPQGTEDLDHTDGPEDSDGTEESDGPEDSDGTEESDGPEDSDGTESSSDAQDGVPDAPTGLVAVYADDAVTLNWDDPGDPSILYYGVWRRDRSTEEFSYEPVTQNTGSTEASYVDATVSECTNYGYLVMARGPSTEGWQNGWSGHLPEEAQVDVPGCPPEQPPVVPDPPPEVEWPASTTVLGDLSAHGALSAVSLPVDDGSGDALYGFTLADVRHMTFALDHDPGLVGFSLEHLDGTVVAGHASPPSRYEHAEILDAGIYLIRLSPRAGTTGNVSLQVATNGIITEAILGADAPGDASTRARMQVGSRIAGTLATTVDHNLGERDWIGVELEAGARYTVALRGQGSMGIEGIISAGGREYGTNEFELWSWRSRTFTVRESGLHFVRLRSRPTFASQRRPTINYTVGVVRVDDPQSCDRDTAGSVAVGEPVDGAIDWRHKSNGGFDCDSFAVPLSSGRLYRLRLDPLEVPGSALPPAQNLQLKYPRGADGQRAHEAVPLWHTDTFGQLLYFGATETETHYVSATGHSRATSLIGHYRLSLDDVTPEAEPPGNRSTTYRLEPDGTVTQGMLVSHLDSDWYRVAMEAGKSYRIEASSRHAAMMIGGIRYDDAARVDAGLLLFPQPGTARVTTWGGGYGTADTVFTPTRSGDYLVEINGNNLGGAARPNRAGPYEVSVSVVETMDAQRFAQIRLDANKYDRGDNFGRTALPPDDGGTSWVRVLLEGNRNYNTSFETGLRVRSPFRRGIYDHNGNILPRSNEGSFSPPKRGYYYIRVGFTRSTNFGASWPHATRTVNFTMTLEETDEEPPGDSGPPHPPPPTAEERMFNSRDESETVVLTPDESHTKQAAQGSAQGVSLRSVQPRSRAASSVPVAALLKTSSESRSARAVSSGSWSGRASSFGAVAAQTASDPDADADDGSSVTVGAGGLDWFMVALTGGDGQSYWVELLGGEHFDDSDEAPAIAAVFDGDGEALYMGDSSEPLRGWRLTPAEDTTYYIAVRSNGNGYAIAVVDTTPPGPDEPDPAADSTTTTSLGVGLDGRLVGMIDSATDTDCYRVDLDGNVEYRIDMQGLWDGHNWGPGGRWVAIGTLGDSVIDGIYGPDGNLIDGTDDPANDNRGTGKDAQLSFAPTVPGAYLVCVSGGSAWTGTYRLSAIETATTGVRLTELLWSGTIRAGRSDYRSASLSGYSFFGNNGDPIGTVDAHHTTDGYPANHVYYALLLATPTSQTLHLGLGEWVKDDIVDDAVLIVGNRTFAIADASTRSSGAFEYSWPADHLTWHNREQITLRLATTSTD